MDLDLIKLCRGHPLPNRLQPSDFDSGLRVLRDPKAWIHDPQILHRDPRGWIVNPSSLHRDPRSWIVDPLSLHRDPRGLHRDPAIILVRQALPNAPPLPLGHPPHFWEHSGNQPGALGEDALQRSPPPTQRPTSDSPDPSIGEKDMNTLLLEYWTEDGDFCMYAEAGSDEQELTLTGQAEAIASKLNLIYEILENKEEHQARQLEQAVETLSQQLIAPFSAQIRACDLIRFLVYEDLIRAPFDLLLYEDKPLFLQRSICYQLDEGQGEDTPQLEVGSALLIADLTADPEEACKQVSQLIPESQYAEMENADLTMIRAAANQVDALVVSAHGDLDSDNCGGVWINDQAIDSQIIKRLEAGIVYFDSCQQGSNLEFLETFQNESEVQFYLAPIISNDAGDSSTKTMLWFFKSLLEHGNPIQALFETRKCLFDFYAIQEELDAIASFNKSFAFRIYEFVES